MVLPPQGPPAIVVTGLTRRLRSRIVIVMNIRLWIIVWLCLFSHATRVWSADQSLVEKRRSYLLTGMRAEREKLRSGQVVMTGDHWRHSSVLGMFRISVRFEIAFDRDSRSSRYTQHDYVQYNATRMAPERKDKQWNRSDLPHGTTPEGVDWVTEEKGGTVVHTPEYDLHLAIGKTHVTRLSPGTVRRTYVREWDLRALGLIDWPSFSGVYHFDDIMNAFETRSSDHSVEMDPSGLSRLTVRFDETEYEIWIDETLGMTPVRISRKELEDPERETSRSDVSWKEINDVIVPIAFRINDLDDPEITEGYDLTLEWSHVNEPLDPKLFTPAGITENKSALIADMRLGQVVVEKVNPLPLAADTVVKPKPPSRLGWIVLGHLIAGGYVSWWYSRRKARRQST